VTTPAGNSGTTRRLTRLCGWVRHLLRPATPGGPSNMPYMDRYSLREQAVSGSNEWRVYLNHFLAGDTDGHHNHSFAWSFSIVLWGSYTEEILGVDPHAPLDHQAHHQVAPGIWATPFGRSVRTRRVRWFNFIRASKYHRITQLHPGPGARGVWTLFFAGPLSGRGWGFFVPGVGHVPWQDHKK
jgi:hypothetical protein